jgi:glutathione S-transferase
MSLMLHFHPLSSFCQKVLVALYENDTPFTPHLVDLGDTASAAAFKALWPIGKFPVLHDDARNWTVPESTIIIEYLALHYPGPVELVARDADVARQERFYDRFIDLYIMQPMQRIVGDRLRPAEAKDPLGVQQARARHRDKDLGDGRAVRHGGLRRRPGAVLRQRDRSAGGPTSQCRGVFRSVDAAAFVCARRRGSGSLPSPLPQVIARNTE